MRHLFQRISLVLCQADNGAVNIVGEVVDEVDSFKYLRSLLQKSFDEDIMHRNNYG